MRIAVVDSGIAAGHPHIGDVGLGVCLAMASSDTLDRIGHGTAVAAAIREKVPDAELVPVKVFDRALATDARTLADAIRWAADHACHIVNLSLGTTNAEHTAVIEAATRYAVERGTVVVAAFESENGRWLPGSLVDAVGVVGDADILRDELLVVDDIESGSRHLVASIYPRPIPGVPRERNLSGISFAVANGSGFLGRILESDGPGLSRSSAAALFDLLAREGQAL